MYVVYRVSNAFYLHVYRSHLIDQCARLCMPYYPYIYTHRYRHAYVYICTCNIFTYVSQYVYMYMCASDRDICIYICSI